MSTIGPEVSNVLKELENEEKAQSLHYLVDKLPEFVSSVKVVEDKLNFIVDALSDQKSLQMIAEDTERKIEQLHIHQEHVDAMLELVHTLPSLVPVVKKMENLMLFAEDVWGDEKTFDAIVKGVNDVIPIKKGAEIIEETNEHFKANEDMAPVSVFGLLRLLKDPAIQHGLKYLQSFLYVMNKHAK
ncbi:DUF1641 domain-containing protein [Cerasibacillus terrae]|uniref:DUF1641 domain-containing protein n=1 Tax=Cerasibacillus terrae TaxID=2498845 RepID=A0A5C8NV31_9BACI|nr:DUF1641 domain-containing protein [Cerasibacillus terrae]TXL65034.1 DUF1641 domain-containing protein [Cerasibacillus terrae]